MNPPNATLFMLIHILKLSMTVYSNDFQTIPTVNTSQYLGVGASGESWSMSSQHPEDVLKYLAHRINS